MPTKIPFNAGSRGAASGQVFWLAVMVLWPVPQTHAAATVPFVLWFERPASDWERESLPVGNGALGAAVQGGIDRDIIQFNEKTLWTGGPGSTEGYDFGIPTHSPLKALRQVRHELRQLGALEPEAVAQRLGQKARGYGHY